MRFNLLVSPLLLSSMTIPSTRHQSARRTIFGDEIDVLQDECDPKPNPHVLYSSLDPTNVLFGPSIHEVSDTSYSSAFSKYGETNDESSTEGIFQKKICLIQS